MGAHVRSSGAAFVNLTQSNADELHQYVTMDEEHIKYLMATGFDKFWRGRRQKERMYVD